MEGGRKRAAHTRHYRDVDYAPKRNTDDYRHQKYDQTNWNLVSPRQLGKRPAIFQPCAQHWARPASVPILPRLAGSVFGLEFAIFQQFCFRFISSRHQLSLNLTIGPSNARPATMLMADRLPIVLSEDEMLRRLRLLLHRKGRLTTRIIEKAVGVPSPACLLGEEAEMLLTGCDVRV